MIKKITAIEIIKSWDSNYGDHDLDSKHVESMKVYMLAEIAAELSNLVKLKENSY